VSRFLFRRLLFCALLTVLAASAALLLTRLAPGDLTASLGPFAPARDVAAARARFALDRPVAVQWGDWVSRAVRFDFGESFLYNRPVAPLVLNAAANTALLAGVALALATVVGFGLGIVTGSRRGGLLPGAIRAASIAAVSMPPLVMTLALVFLAARTGWLPLTGLALPSIALAVPLAAAFERLQASALDEQVREPFVLAAAARGVPPGSLVLRHAWPASLRSLTAIYGLAIGSLLSGSFVVEFVTAWPGLGRLMYDALRARDIYLVAGCAAVGAGLLSIGILIGDLLLVLVDPRVRES
jgi:ABC-type dipeptide/oligopeptide/nickel transport system permease component